MEENNIVIYILSSGVILMVFAILLIWFLNFSKKKLVEAKLAEQENEIQFQIDLLHNTVNTQENERERIARELHDDITSKLNIIHLNMHLLKQKLDNDEETVQFVDHIETSLQESIQRTRNISHELIPLILLKFGFQKAFSDLVDSINMTGRLQVKFEGEHHIKITNNYKELHIYRILQELFNNTLKYAEADNIIVNFEEEPDNFIKLIYKDDGIGINPKNNKIGLGSKNIKTRIKLLQGESNIISRDREGFLFIAKFPNYD